MFESKSSVHALAVIVATTCLTHALPAFSQSTASPPTGRSAEASPTSTQPEASAANSAQKRASSKAARQANRARKNAELGTLEKNGYNPATGDNTYPESLQKAERKSNGQ